VPSRLPGLSLALAASLALGLLPTFAQEQQPIRFLGEFDLPPNSLTVDQTTVGGLSGLTYDPRRDVFYVISDDRGEHGPARFYTVTMTLDPSGVSNVQFLSATPLDSDADTPGVQPYGENESDTEDIVLLPDDTLLISSERDAHNEPWVRRFALDGTLLADWPLPDVFLAGYRVNRLGQNQHIRGSRANLSLESLAYDPDTASAYTMQEEALIEDGPVSTTAEGTLVRMLRFNLAGGQAVPDRQVTYKTEPIFAQPIPANATADNGVSAMVWVRNVLPPYDLLVMERAFVTGVGGEVNLFGATLGDADDVSSLAAVPQPFQGRSMTKTRLANLSSLGIVPDNLEGLTLGPRLPDGRQSLIAISDDNFSPIQTGQFLLFELTPAR
jgi:hypothetical protein